MTNEADPAESAGDMRLFASFCFAVAMFYGFTAVNTMRTGVAYAMRGNESTEHRREDPESKYRKFLAARWLAAAGFLVLGVAMQMSARYFDKLETHAK